MFAAPSESPQNVMSVSLSSTRIFVTWEEVPPMDRNGIITLYEVLVIPLETFGQLTLGMENTTDLFLTLTDLHPFVDYNISVRAFTSIGSGPYSDFLVERTMEDRKLYRNMPLCIMYGGIQNFSSHLRSRNAWKYQCCRNCF